MDNQEVLEKRKKTEKVLANISTLPSIPEVMFEVTKLLDDPSVSTTALAKIIGKDQGLVTKILSIANSPLYGLARRVSTIDYAIIILGFQEIKNMVIALSMMEAFKIKNDKILNYKDFWVHSILTGAAARRLAVEFEYANTGEAFVAGLLHDLGISVIHKYFHTSFQAILKLVEEGKTFLEAEEEVLGLTHQEMAKFLAEHWNFPSSLSEAIAHHHLPGKSVGDKKLASIIHFADFMVNKIIPDKYFWDAQIQIDTSVFDILKISNAEQAEALTEKYRPLIEEEINLAWF